MAKKMIQDGDRVRIITGNYVGRCGYISDIRRGKQETLIVVDIELEVQVASVLISESDVIKIDNRLTNWLRS